MPIKESRSGADPIDAQLTESIHQLHEVSTRIDERIKYLIEKQSDMSEKLEKFDTLIGDNSTRLAILEKSGIYQVRDKIDELDKKHAVLERQMNNGMRSDVNDLKAQVRLLELSNESNISHRTRSENRFEFYMNLAWKTICSFGAVILVYKLGFK